MLHELTSDQEFFQETTQRFLTDKVPPALLRERRAFEPGFERGYWGQGAELGWTSLLVGEADGGGSISGEGLVDLTLVAYEFGRHAAPGPLTGANVVAAALSRAGTEVQRKEVLGGIISGEVVATWCVTEPRPDDGLGTVRLRATAADGDVVLDGTKVGVEAGAQADVLLVTARTGDGLTQVLVPSDTAGVAIVPMHGLDLSRRFARITFDDVKLPASAVVGSLGGADELVELQLQVALAIQLAETVGTMDRALDMTLDWAFNRYSFGRPLASYQEIKHRFADMKCWLEASHAIADAAAAAVEHEAEDAAELVSVAKSYVGDHSTELIHDCVQIHGGIGVTFDHDLHLFLRRATQNRNLYGTPVEHRRRLVTLLERKEASA